MLEVTRKCYRGARRTTRPMLVCTFRSQSASGSQLASARHPAIQPHTAAGGQARPAGGDAPQQRLACRPRDPREFPQRRLGCPVAALLSALQAAEPGASPACKAGPWNS